MSSHDHRVFGYYHLPWLFQEIVRVEDEAIFSKKKHRIGFGKIYAMRTYPDFEADRMFSLLGFPQRRITLYLRDGGTVRIHGPIKRKCDLCQKGRWLSGNAEDYEELVQYLRRAGVARWNGPKESEVVFRTMLAFQVLGWLLGFGAGYFWFSSGSYEVVFVSGAVLAATMSVLGLLAGALIAMRLVGRHVRSQTSRIETHSTRRS